MKECHICQTKSPKDSNNCNYCQVEFEDMIDPYLLMAIRDFEATQTTDWIEIFNKGE